MYRVVIELETEEDPSDILDQFQDFCEREFGIDPEDDIVSVYTRPKKLDS